MCCRPRVTAYRVQLVWLIRFSLDYCVLQPAVVMPKTLKHCYLLGLMLMVEMQR